MSRVALLLALLSAPVALAEDAPAAALSAEQAQAEDPFQWLEDVSADRSLDWVRARNQQSEGEIGAVEGFAGLEQRLLQIMDSDDRIPYVSRMGKFYYNFWVDAEHPRGLWRRTTPGQYAKADPKWDVLLDVDALGKAEGESWVWEGSSCLKPAYTRCLVRLSRGGSDAEVVREYDLSTRAFVQGGFTLPEAKSDVSWIDQDTLFVATDFGEGTLTDSGYSRQVKRWRRGTPLAEASLIFEGQQSDVSVDAWHDDSEGYERDLVRRGITFFTNELFLIRDGRLLKIDKPDDANAGFYKDWLMIELRTDWDTGAGTYPGGALLAIKVEDFLSGKRDFQALFTPDEHSSLVSFSATKSAVILNQLVDVRSHVVTLKPGPQGWVSSPVPGLPENATVNAWGVDADHSDEIFLTVTDYLTPTSLLYGKVGKGAPKVLKSTPAWFDTAGLQVSQHFATSKDGTKIPYFEVSRADLKLDGANPTLLYGYGGFEISLQPYYSGGIGAGWLEKGGVYVVANIRGGGEFGPRWHQAALKENRNKAYEDFAAVAEDLAKRGVASAAHLGIQGGSNGGLLMGNMLTGWPELFKAVVCQVPLLDMKRYTHLLAGASWMGEYGDPDDPEQWAWLQRYSPYHKVSAGVTYPRTLFMTSTRDDRVHPGHARKMAAKMLDQGHDILYYENIEGGHGGAADNKQRAHMWALAYSFLWKELN